MCTVSTCAEASSIFAFVREHSATWHWDRWALILKLLLVGSCLPHFSAEQSGRPAGQLRFWTFGELEILFACQLAKDTGEYPRPLVFFSYNSEQCVMQILLAAPDSVVIWVWMIERNLGWNFGWRWGCWTVTVDGLVSPVLASAPQSGLPDGQPVRPATRGVSPAE